MKTLFCAFLSILVFYFAAPTFARADDGESDGANTNAIHVLIAPVVSYQSLQRTIPYDHTNGMVTYGARVVVGTYELTGEFEIQYGSDSENFTSPDIGIDTTFWQARLGARKIFPITAPVHLLARAGLEAYHYSDTYYTETGINSASTAWQFRPYLGGGVIFYLFKSLSLSVEEVYVLNTSWETDFGFRLFI